jgi:myxalamid-type nonribosomal peptide synthetase MxaA
MTTPHDLSNLSAEEKRAVLAKMLRERAAQPAPKPADGGFGAVIASAREQLASGPGVAARDLSASELRAEATLDPTIVPKGPPADGSDPQQVLLTGATGFLGGYLLRELLDRTRAVVYCVVRAPNPEQGTRRLREVLAERGLWAAEFAGRVVAVPGDLTQPRLGLSEAEFTSLAERLDGIYHNGALVNFLARYSALRATNVQGTVELLRLACHRRPMPMHAVSSFSVVPLFEYLDAGLVPEMDDLDPDRPVQGGYVQSKWVAEKLVHAARDRGLPVTVHRPGYVAGHSRTGFSNLDDLVCRFLKSCVVGQVAPALDMEVDITPVDYVAAAVVHLSLRSDSLGHAFYLVNPRPILWADMLATLREMGYPVREAPYAVWQQFLTQHAGASAEQNPLAMLAALFPVGPTELSTVPRFRCDVWRTEAGLAGTDIACPPADSALVRRYVSHLARCGFLPAPRAK